MTRLATRCSLWLSAVLLPLLVNGANGALVTAQHDTGQRPQPAFHSAVDLVTLHVTVTDGGGRYVEDLDAGEFQIFENGRPQDVRVFEPGGLPLAVTLLLDVSSSMSYVFPDVQEAAVQFLRQLQPHDLASIVAFGESVQVLQPFTGDRQALESAVRHATARGATRLYNALYVGLRELVKPMPDEREVPRRRVAVLLTDGDDTASLVSFDAVLDLAKRSDIAVYAIRLGEEVSVRKDTREPEFVLQQLTKHTGGRAFLSLSQSDLRRVYTDIRTELARQYALGFVSTDGRRDGAYRYLSVHVTRPGARARARLGYFAPAALLSPRIGR